MAARCETCGYHLENGECFECAYRELRQLRETLTKVGVEVTYRKPTPLPGHNPYAGVIKTTDGEWEVKFTVPTPSFADWMEHNFGGPMPGDVRTVIQKFERMKNGSDEKMSFIPGGKADTWLRDKWKEYKECFPT